jgi:hypothetical protein
LTPHWVTRAQEPDLGNRLGADEDGRHNPTAALLLTEAFVAVDVAAVQLLQSPGQGSRTATAASCRLPSQIRPSCSRTPVTM